MNPNRWRLFLCLLPLVALLNGCATHAVWGDGALTHFYGPAPAVNLQAYESPKTDAVLLVYNEIREDKDVARRRAFWLQPSLKAAENPYRPHFVSLDQAAGLRELPVQAIDAADVSAPGGRYIRLSAQAHEFELFDDGHRLGQYELPVYKDPKDRVWQVALTPVAVVVDVSALSTAAAIYVLATEANSPVFNPDRDGQLK